MRIEAFNNVVKISEIKNGTKIYTEQNSVIATSGKLQRDKLLSSELEGIDYTPMEMPYPIAQAHAISQMGEKHTQDRKNRGEQAYVLCSALADSQSITIRGCCFGQIMIWNNTPMKKGEKFEPNQSAKVDFVAINDETGRDEEVHFTNVKTSLSMKRAHGTLYAVEGAFLAAELTVKAKVYHTNDTEVKHYSKTEDSFQRFYGKGNVFLNVNGGLIEHYLHPNQSINIWPGYLLGFTAGIGIKMQPAGDVILRNEENNDYVIQLTAGKKGGFVYEQSVLKKEN